MLDRKIVSSSWYCQNLPHNILRILNGGRKRVQVVLRVQIEVGDMVTQSFHVGTTTGNIIALRIRRPHVGWILSNDIGNGTFILNHLLLAHSSCDIREAIVGPCMRCHLMALSNHALNYGRVGFRFVNWSYILALA